MRAVRSRGIGQKIAVTSVLAIAAIVGLAGCTSGASSSGGDPAGSSGFTSDISSAATSVAAPEAERDSAGAPAAAPSSAAAAGGTGQAADQPAASPDQLFTAPADGSKVIKTADLSIKLAVEPVPTTDDQQADREANAAARAAAIAQAGAGARSIAAAAGGFQFSADGGGSQMSLTLRVPAEQYDAAVDKLTGLGDLTNRTETSQDVTGQVADVNSRVDSMTASVGRVRALLAAATDIADVISIESELAVREANLESLQQQQAALSGQVALSTISLNLAAITKDVGGVEPAAPDNGFVAGFKSGWSALLGFLGGFAATLGAVLPFLPLIAAVGLLGWWLIRRTRGRVQPPSGASEQAAEQYPA
jgi:hypothetical protein